LLVAALAAGGCMRGDVREIDFRRDLPADVMDVLRARKSEQLFVVPPGALPWFYLHHGEIRREHDPEGLHAERRSIYGSGLIAQRFHDANFDGDGRNLSFRITELWFMGLVFRYDEVKWSDGPGAAPDAAPRSGSIETRSGPAARKRRGRVRRYLDATVLFGAFGYSETDYDKDIVLFWLPIPIP
jgi:hypothetical protein